MGTGEIYLDFAAIMLPCFAVHLFTLCSIFIKKVSAKVFRFVTTDRLIPTAPV